MMKNLTKLINTSLENQNKFQTRTKLLSYLQTQQTYFSVNLDDVYHGPAGPFFTLAKTDQDRKNVFQLSSRLHFTDGTVSKEFFSKPFLIRTQKHTDDVKVHTLVCDQVFASNVGVAVDVKTLKSEEFDVVKVLYMLFKRILQKLGW